MSYAKNALFVRQTIAVALGISISQELTWELIEHKVCYDDIPMPKEILVKGIPALSITKPLEAKKLLNFLNILKVNHNIEIKIVLHD